MDRRTPAADLPGMIVSPDPMAVATSDDIDLVVIASPNDSHGTLAHAALSAGKHVVVDKPFTLDLADARRLVALAADRGRILSVFHNTTAYAHARTFIVRNYFVKAVVSLPRNAFEFLAKTKAKTSILILTKKPDTDVRQQEPVMFARADVIGYTSTGVAKQNDLRPIVDAFTEWKGQALQAWEGGLLQKARLEPAIAALEADDRIILGSLAVDEGQRLDVAYRRMRNLVAAMPSHIHLGDVVEDVVRHPKTEATDEDAVLHSYAFVSSIDGRVRSRGEQDLKYLSHELRVIRKDDILISGIDAVHGAIGVVADDCDGRVVSKEYFTLTVRQDRKGDVSPQYVARLLRSRNMRAVIEGFITGVSKRMRVESAAELLKLPIPDMPPIDEQMELADRVRQAFEAQDRAAEQFEVLEERLSGSMIARSPH